MNERSHYTSTRHDNIPNFFSLTKKKRKENIFLLLYNGKERRKKQFLIWNVERPTTNSRKKTKIKFLFKCSFYNEAAI